MKKKFQQFAGIVLLVFISLFVCKSLELFCKKNVVKHFTKILLLFCQQNSRIIKLALVLNLLRILLFQEVETLVMYIMESSMILSYAIEK